MDQQQQSSSSSKLFVAQQHESLNWKRRDSSRLLEEYVVLKTLGRGAFGSVHLVQNKVDGSLYALKRVQIIQKENSSSLKEAQVLPSLSHEQHVVRYYGAWIETSSSNDEQHDFLDDDEMSSELFSSSTSNPPFIIDDPTCNLCESSYTDWEVSFEQWGLIDVTLQPLNLCVDCYQKSLPHNNNHDITIRQKQPTLQYLCILMEYCEHTLLEGLSKHNNSGDDEERWNLFRQCLLGLDYLHQQDILHRDCKPSNIFIRNGVVKIGDLGLRSSIGSGDREEQGDDSSSNNMIGTFLYRAPEVGRRNLHDGKASDVYSMGVVLVELFCAPFHTGMERVVILSGLQDGKLPEHLDATAAGDLARRMLASNPADWPSCRDILLDLSNSSSAALDTTSLDLQRQLKESQDTVRQLQALLDKHNIDYSHITKE